MIKRRRTRQIKVGDVKIGGGSPISIQSMTKVRTSDIGACVRQIKQLEGCGCDIVRVAVKDRADAQAVAKIKRGIHIPVVCDIHFDYRLALLSIRSGADKIRLNPGNIGKLSEIKEVLAAAKKARIPIRIGVNSGSVAEKITSRSKGGAPGSNLVRSALGYVKIFEESDFRDIIISLKASDVVTTIEAYREIAKECSYPLHLGVTASGPSESGAFKSAIGIGALLVDGIGDTIRVSLTADPVEEVIAARRILGAVNLGKPGHQIISCPTCGRCQVNLAEIVKELERKLSTIDCRLSTNRPLKIAIMGCEVNGPGEARCADIGVAFGKDCGILFKKGRLIKKVTVKNAVKELLTYALD